MATYDLAKANELKDKLGKLILEINVNAEKLDELKKKYDLVLIKIVELDVDGYSKHKAELETLKEDYLQVKAEMLNLDDELFALRTEYKSTKDQFVRVRFHVLFDEEPVKK